MESFPASDPPAGGPGAEAHASGPSAAELVKEDHMRIRDSLNDVANSHGGERRHAFDALLRVLSAHEDAGQALLHPTVSRIRSDVASARLTEEKAIREQVRTLEELDIDDSDFDELFREFRDFLMRHFYAEEASELPLLDEACGEMELRALSQALLRLRDVADARR